MDLRLSDRLGEVLNQMTDLVIDAEVYTLHFATDEPSDVVVCSLGWRQPIERERIAEVARSVFRIRHDIGCFEFDMASGSLGYRIGAQNASALISEPFLREMVRNALAASDELRAEIYGLPAPAEEDGDDDVPGDDPMAPVVLAAFESLGIDLTYEPGERVASKFLYSDDAEFLVIVTWYVPSSTFYCAVRWLKDVPEEKHDEAIALACRVNRELTVGRLDFREEEGSLTFVDSVGLAGAPLTPEIVSDIFHHCWEMAHELDPEVRALTA